MGKLAKDMDQVRAPIAGGWRYGWVAGRGGRQAGPSLEDAGDGRPWTYHDPSPLVGLGAWREIVACARRSSSAAGWAAGVRGDLGAWLRSLPADEVAMAWAGLRAP